MTLLRFNLGCGPHKLPGFMNLDLPLWAWGMALPANDATVDGITISHALMYAPAKIWRWVFADIHRALKPGGVVRITEDATDDPRSERRGGFHDAITLTSSYGVQFELARAGFAQVVEVGPDVTLNPALDLMQQWHGAPPKVFFVEGMK